MLFKSALSTNFNEKHLNLIQVASTQRCVWNRVNLKRLISRRMRINRVCAAVEALLI